eukprot:gene4312-5397_t
MKNNDNLSYFEGSTEYKLQNDITINQLLLENVKKNPTKIAIILENKEFDDNQPQQNSSYKTITYKELYDQVNYLSSGLIDIGIKKGDYVSIWCQNRLEPVLFYYALANIGAISINLYPYVDSIDFQHIMNISKCKLLVYLDHGFESFKNEHLQVLNQIIPELTTHATTSTTESTSRLNNSKLQYLEKVVTIHDNNSNNNSSIFNFKSIMKRGRELLENGTIDLEEYRSKVSSQDPYTVLLTSGSTGKHKLVVHSQFGFLNNILLSNKRIGFNSDDVLGNVAKMFLASGKLQLNMHILAGATMVLACDYDKFDPLLWLKWVERHRITTACGAPAFYFSVLNHPQLSQYNISSWSKGLVYAFPLPLSLGESIRRTLGPGILHSYGMSETMLTFSTMPTTSEHQFINTVGRINPHCLAKIVDENNEIVGIGELGQLVVQTYSFMLGYLGDPIKTQETIIDGWLYTNDLARLDNEGNLTILGRMQDILSCFIGLSQVKFSTKEIEDFLIEHPKIHDVQVFGIKNSAKTADIIVAWVILKPGNSTLTIDELKLYFQGSKSISKLPEILEIVNEFPLNESLKPVKRKMRELTIEKLAK